MFIFCKSASEFLKPIEGVLVPKLTSSKSAEGEAKRRMLTVGKDSHEDHITAAVFVGERCRARSETFFLTCCFSMIDSTLAGVPRTRRDKRLHGRDLRDNQSRRPQESPLQSFRW